MGRDRKRVAGRGRTVGLLLERTGTEGPGECPVLCRSQLAAVCVLVGGAGQRGNDAGDGCSVFAGRLPVNAGGFSCWYNTEKSLLVLNCCPTFRQEYYGIINLIYRLFI